MVHVLSFHNCVYNLQKQNTKTGTVITVEKWFGSSREVAAVRTVCSHITNMVTGVSKVSIASGCGILLEGIPSCVLRRLKCIFA